MDKFWNILNTYFKNQNKSYEKRKDFKKYKLYNVIQNFEKQQKDAKNMDKVWNILHTYILKMKILCTINSIFF